MARTRSSLQSPLAGVVSKTTPQAYTWTITKEADIYTTAHVLREVADTLIDRLIPRIEFDNDDDGSLIITALREQRAPRTPKGA